MSDNTEDKTKQCSKCKRILLVECFDIAKKYKSGRASWCKDCCKEYRLAHKDHKKEYDRQRQPLISEARKVYMHKYYEENKEALLIKDKQYRLEHYDKIRAYDRKWKETHKKERKQYNMEYWNKTKDSESKKSNDAGRLRSTGWSPENYKLASEAQNNCCAICGKHVDEVGTLCADHDHSTGNIRALLCDKCNRGLGYFQDNPELLKKAAEFLSFYNLYGEKDIFIKFDNSIMPKEIKDVE